MKISKLELLMLGLTLCCIIAVSFVSNNTDEQIDPTMYENTQSDIMVMAEQSDITLININSANSENLERLPNIGATLASRIIEYREENGPFTDPSQLMEVYGIGETTYLALADFITIEE